MTTTDQYDPAKTERRLNPGDVQSVRFSNGSMLHPGYNEVEVDRFLLEYDTERAGGFEPLRLVPRGKTVVLGLVTTKAGALERKDDLLRRIEEASRYVPLENLALSPQCGFASVAEGNLLSDDEQWRKLELIVETAREVWG